MQQIGFLKEPRLGEDSETANDVLYEDAMADRVGAFALSLVKCRCRRMLYLVEGYPHRLHLCLSAHADLFREFHSRCLDYESLKPEAHPTKLMREFLDRSLFEQLAVEQLALACRDVGYFAHPDLQAEMRQRGLGIISTTVVEDINNAQKNSRKLTNWGGRYRRPQTALAATVRCKVLHNTHRWLEPRPQQPSAFAPPSLEKDATSARACKAFLNASQQRSERMHTDYGRFLGSVIGPEGRRVDVHVCTTVRRVVRR